MAKCFKHRAKLAQRLQIGDAAIFPSDLKETPPRKSKLH
jgi:hypothetical protein